MGIYNNITFTCLVYYTSDIVNAQVRLSACIQIDEKLLKNCNARSTRGILKHSNTHTHARGSRKVVGGWGPDPPGICKAFYRRYYWKWKKNVFFHICALPQLYVKQNQSYLRLDPPGNIFWIRAWHIQKDVCILPFTSYTSNDVQYRSIKPLIIGLRMNMHAFVKLMHLIIEHVDLRSIIYIF